MALVHAIHTNDAYRGRGIQKKLAAMTEELAKEEGFKGVFVFSNNGVTDHIFVGGLGYERISEYDTHQYQDQQGRKVFEHTSEFNRQARLLLKKSL